MVFSRVVMSVNGYGAVIRCDFFFSSWLMLVCRDCACEELRGEVWLEKNYIGDGDEIYSNKIEGLI